MEIHKPKPWHGWREFLKEYVIIVLGVLTALGGEAFAENIHWRHMVEAHDAQLLANAHLLGSNALQLISTDACLRNGLQHVAEKLRQPVAEWVGLNGGTTGHAADYLPTNLDRPSRNWPYAAWESVTADGSTLHFPEGRLRDFAIVFRTSQALQEEQQKVEDLLPELTPLSFDQTLSPQEKARYLALVARIDRSEQVMTSMARSILTVESTSDLWPPESDLSPLIDGVRKRFGACAQTADRRDFQPEGKLAQSILIRRP